ncbi:MAG: glycosyltransferase family 4 protein [Anaerolineales bacterium]|nr:glycosyltransferase family 4 protein [Anaerolineales bacterium]
MDYNPGSTQGLSAHIALNAHLLSGRTSYRSAGIHHYIAQLLRHLPAAAPELRFTVFVGDGRPDMAGATVVRARLPTARPPMRIFWEQCVQPWALARARPALLHALAFVAPILSPTPTVVTVYDLSFFVTPERFPAAQRLYLRALTGVSCRRARRVLAISESTRADVVRLLGVPAERVDLAYPGVGPEFHPLPADEVAAFRARLNLPARFVLYLGTLEPRKNLGTLLAAFATLRAAEPDLALVLAGGRGWWYADLFRQVQALGLERAVHFPGYVPAQDLPGWYNAAAAVGYPSAYEGFGMPVAEALACGCPVVTTRASSLPEAGGEAAWLVPPADAPALAAALAQALRPDPARRGRGLAHAARFTWAATAAATAASYRRALGRPA